MGKMILGILSVLAVLTVIFYIIFDFNSELEEQKESIELFKNSDLKGRLYVNTSFRGLNYQKSFLSPAVPLDGNFGRFVPEIIANPDNVILSGFKVLK